MTVSGWTYRAGTLANGEPFEAWTITIHGTLVEVMDHPNTSGVTVGVRWSGDNLKRPHSTLDSFGHGLDARTAASAFLQARLPGIPGLPS